MRSGDRVSPNQAEKQRQIVEAAKLVLARDGLAACTARAVAEASPLTKSAIHYYFGDLDEVIDQAMASHIAAFTDRLRSAAGRHDTPSERFWAAVNEYFAIFQELPNSLVLWQEYWIDSVRRKRLAVTEGLFQDITAFYAELLAALNVDEPLMRARGLLSYLVGAVTQQAVGHHSADEVRAQVAALCRLG